MTPKITGDNTHTILVCHSNGSLVRMAQVQATRHGIRLLIARNSEEVMKIALGQLRPDAIVLSNDLKNPSTDELVKKLNADPRLKGVQVVVVKGMLDGISQLLKGFKRPPWNIGFPKV